MSQHDYPACAIFRGGKCTCDEADKLCPKCGSEEWDEVFEHGYPPPIGRRCARCDNEWRPTPEKCGKCRNPWLCDERGECMDKAKSAWAPGDPLAPNVDPLRNSETGEADQHQGNEGEK